MIRKSGYRFSEKIMLKSNKQSEMTFRRKVITLSGGHSISQQEASA
jgi:hypothetical protein